MLRRCGAMWGKRTQNCRSASEKRDLGDTALWRIEAILSNSRVMKHEGDPRLRWLGVICLFFVGQTLQGCLYDSDQPCDDGMVFSEEFQRCICPDASAYTPDGCVACGEHEVASATGCVCEAGYARPAADQPCTEVPMGLGAECDPSAPACPAPYDHCEAAGESGYCTISGCTSSDDCEGGYACNDESVCQRPPVGLGQSCATPEDCAGTEATFCDSFMTQSCQVQGCSLDPDDCFAGFECCDLSAFGLPEPLCIPEGACMP